MHSLHAVKTWQINVTPFRLHIQAFQDGAQSYCTVSVSSRPSSCRSCFAWACDLTATFCQHDILAFSGPLALAWTRRLTLRPATATGELCKSRFEVFKLIRTQMIASLSSPRSVRGSRLLRQVLRDAPTPNLPSFKSLIKRGSSR